MGKSGMYGGGKTRSDFQVVKHDQASKGEGSLKYAIKLTVECVIPDMQRSRLHMGRTLSRVVSETVLWAALGMRTERSEVMISPRYFAVQSLISQPR